MQDMTVYTIGYGGRKPNDFLDLLALKGIKAIVDIRRRPRSYSGHYTRAKDPGKGIQGLLTGAGIEYVWIEELGNPFKDQDGWAKKYEEHLDQLVNRLADMLHGVPAPYCLMCCEKRVAQCHRKLLAARLAEAGAQVEHIE